MDDNSERTAFDKVLTIEEPGTPIESAGTWSSLVKNLCFTNEDEFSAYIEEKTVLDVGSGMGGLFKEAKIRGNTANIININPRFSLKDYRKEAHEFYEMTSDDIPANIDMEVLNKEHDQSAIAAFSNNLPIKDSAIDIIVDSKGAVYHCLYQDYIDNTGILQTEYKPNNRALEETLNEYLRVLTKGGKARIGGLLSNIEEGTSLLTTALKNKNIQYTIIMGADNTFSIEIVKN